MEKAIGSRGRDESQAASHEEPPSRRPTHSPLSHLSDVTILLLHLSSAPSILINNTQVSSIGQNFSLT